VKSIAASQLILPLGCYDSGQISPLWLGNDGVIVGWDARAVDRGELETIIDDYGHFVTYTAVALGPLSTAVDLTFFPFPMDHFALNGVRWILCQNAFRFNSVTNQFDPIIRPICVVQ
jgi:hypothetical protein